jgi:hypothetical protein
MFLYMLTGHFSVMEWGNILPGFLFYVKLIVFCDIFNLKVFMNKGRNA